jgi:hypothetical protein
MHEGRMARVARDVSSDKSIVRRAAVQPFNFNPEGFSAEEFELATWDSKFVEQINFNIETHQKEDLEELLVTGILPYRDVGDVLRHGLQRHLMFLEYLGLLHHKAAYYTSRHDEVHRAREWHRALNFQIVMDFAHRLLIGGHQCTRRMLEIRILKQLIGELNHMPSQRLRRIHLEAFKKRFSFYLYDLRISTGLGESIHLESVEKRVDTLRPRGRSNG